MRTRHLYSLFNNAIGNAIEAVKKLDNPAMRTISVTVAKQNDAAVIEVTNFFDGKPIEKNSTSKSDHNHHGFGTMSMRYIAESYGGHIRTYTEGQLYCVTVILPTPKNL